MRAFLIANALLYVCAVGCASPRDQNGHMDNEVIDPQDDDEDSAESPTDDGTLVGGGGNSSDNADDNGGEGGYAAMGGQAGQAAPVGMDAGSMAGTAGMGGQAGKAPVEEILCTAQAGCEGFESHTTGSRPGTPWKDFETPGGTIVVDESRAFSGKRSVKILATAGDSRVVRMGHSGNGLLPADKLYARMMVWLDAAPQGNNLHWNWIRMGGDARGESGGKLHDVTVAPGGSSTGTSWTHYGGGASGGYQDCFVRGAQKLPTGRWACVEMMVNAQTDDVDIWIDGKHDDLTSVAGGATVPGIGACVPGHDFTMGRWLIPKINRLAFGFSMAHTLGASRTMWIDEVVVGGSRVGCPRRP